MAQAITIKELTTTVAESAHTTKVAAEKVIGDLFSSITSALKDHDEVVIRDFGRFYVHTRSARKGRNPKTGESIQIAAKTIIKFSPRGSLK
jgi:DNA-binding protein HU-beta